MNFVTKRKDVFHTISFDYWCKPNNQIKNYYTKIKSQNSNINKYELAYSLHIFLWYRNLPLTPKGGGALTLRTSASLLQTHLLLKVSMCMTWPFILDCWLLIDWCCFVKLNDTFGEGGEGMNIHHPPGNPHGPSRKTGPALRMRWMNSAYALGVPCEL